MDKTLLVQIHNDLSKALSAFQKEYDCSEGTAISLILRRYFHAEGYLPLSQDDAKNETSQQG